MHAVSVIIGKPSKFYHKGKQISVDTAFGLYQKKAKFITKGTNGNRFGEEEANPIGELLEIVEEDVDQHIQEGLSLRIKNKIMEIYRLKDCATSNKNMKRRAFQKGVEYTRRLCIEKYEVGYRQGWDDFSTGVWHGDL